MPRTLLGLCRVPAGNAILRVDIVEVIRNILGWIPLLRRGFDFHGSRFHRVDGTRARR